MEHEEKKEPEKKKGWSKTEYDYGQMGDDTGDMGMWRNLTLSEGKP